MHTNIKIYCFRLVYLIGGVMNAAIIANKGKSDLLSTPRSTIHSYRARPILLRIGLSRIHIFSRIITQQDGTVFFREVALLKECYIETKILLVCIYI